MDKVIIDGVYPQTNYTTQQFYTKEEYDKLQAENEKLKTDIGIYKGIIDAYKEENEQIKKDYAKLHIDFAKCNKENETLERTNNELRKRFSEDTTKLSAKLKELKADIESRTMCITCERELQNCNLQVENERLKAEVEYLEEEKKEKIKLLEQIIKILYPNASDDELFTVTFNSEYIDKLKNYIQALQEIRELIKKLDLSLGCAYGDYDCDNCSDINEETVCKIKLQNIILAKINEVIGAE